VARVAKATRSHDRSRVVVRPIRNEAVSSISHRALDTQWQKTTASYGRWQFEDGARRRGGVGGIGGGEGDQVERVVVPR